MNSAVNQFDTVVNRMGTYSIKWDGIGLDYKNPDLTPMSIADMDFKAPQEVIDAIVRQAQVGIYGYAMPAECSTSLITDWLAERNDWHLKEDEVGFVVRVVDAISLAVRALTKEGEAVATFTPLYVFFEEAVVNARRELVRNRLVRTEAGYEIDFDALERQIEEHQVKVFILCNPHNPTGRVWTTEELEHLLDVCARHDVTIVSDDIHSDLIMPGHTYTPIAKLAENRGFEDVLTMKSASKTFNLAGIQLGYYCSKNPAIMKAMEAEKLYTTYPDLPNNFAIAAIDAAYHHGVPWLEGVCDYIAGNFAAFKDLVAREFPKAHLAELEGTYLTWLDVSYLADESRGEARVTEKQLMDRLDESGLGAETTSSFGLTDKDGLFIRMNIACPRATLDKGLEALEKALKSLE